VHPFIRPEAFLEYASFEEATGDVEKARDLYKHVLKEVSPGLTEAIINLVNLERRQGNMKVALETLTKAMEEGEDNLADLTTFAAKFVRNHLSDEDKALNFFEEAVKKVPGNISLWLAYISMESSKKGCKFDVIKDLYERALGSNHSDNDTVILAAHYMEYAANNAKSIKIVREIQSRFPNVSTLLVFNEKKGQDIPTQTQQQNAITAQTQQSTTVQPTTSASDQSQSQSQSQTASYDQQTRVLSAVWLRLPVSSRI